jgi:hypothetical protein
MTILAIADAASAVCVKPGLYLPVILITHSSPPAKSVKSGLYLLVILLEWFDKNS